MADNDGVLWKCGEVNNLFTKKVSEKTSLYVSNVCSALTEELILHAKEHVVVHVVCVTYSLLNAGATVNCAVNSLFDALILSKLNVSTHNSSGFLAHRLGHTLNLCVSLCNKLSYSLCVTSLLCSCIFNSVWSKSKIWIYGNLSSTDADSTGRIDSLKHTCSYHCPRSGVFSSASLSTLDNSRRNKPVFLQSNIFLTCYVVSIVK